MINACFQMGLKDDNLFRFLTSDDCCRPVTDFINYVLDLKGSKFLVDVEDHPPPNRKHVDAPAHHKPALSTYGSNEPTPSVPPTCPLVLRSSSLVLSPEPPAAAH